MFSVEVTEDGDNYYVDNATGEATWELPDDAFIMEKDLEQPPQLPEDPPCVDAPRRRLHQFSISVTEDGDECFINNETQEAVWDLPEDGEVVEI